MKNLLANKKGSTLVLLVIAIGVISLLGTSIMGVTMMNYKIKKANTEMKQSFYISEAGLDLAYANAYELVQKSLEKATKDSQEFIKSFDNIRLSELIEYAVNNPGDYDAEEYLLDTNDDTIVDSYNETIIIDEAKLMFGTNFRGYVTSGLTYKVNEDDEEDITIDGIQELINESDEKSEVMVETISYDAGTEAEKIWNNLTLNISSTSNTDYQKKTIVDIVITVPTYNESYTVKTDVIKVDKKWMNVLTADNIIISTEASGESPINLSVEGNVFAYNNLELNGSNVNSTFEGELVVKGGNDLDTGGIFLNGAGSTINIKDVYAKNIIMNGSNTKFLTTGADLSKIREVVTSEDELAGEVSKVYVKDDLEMKSTKQKVQIIGSYYGFSTGGSSEVSNDQNSAIIINSSDIAGTDGSALKITNKLYLLGTSYIKNTPYSTGESLSIKGNYFVYSMPLTGGTSYDMGNYYSLDWNQLDTVYHEPLPPLVYQFTPKDETGNIIKRELMKVWNKSDYFNQYKVGTDYSGSGLVLGGSNIQLNNSQTKSLGLTVSNGSIVLPVPYDEEIEAFQLNTVKNIYNPRLIYKTEDEFFFGGTENFNKVTDNEVVYIGNDNISITNNIWTTGTLFDRGLIVTNGNIDIYGKFSFTGAIICGGDLTFHNDGKDKKIKYNENVVGTAISKYNLDESLFTGDASSETMLITTYDSGDSSENVDFSSILYFRNWKN